MEEEVILYKAKFKYSPEHADELVLEKGDIVRLIKKDDGAWWEGEIYKSQNASRGWFPSNYVRELKPAELEKIKSKDEKNPKKSIAQNTESQNQDRIQIETKFRQTVSDEINQLTAQFINDINHIIHDIYPKVTNNYSFNKLIKSLNQIKIAEEKLNGLIMTNFNLDRSNTKIGTVFLENMDEIRSAYESYYSNHPSTVESLRKDTSHGLDDYRSHLAKPLLRLEGVPLKLRDLEKYYGDSDEDRLELGRAIYQLEQCLHKCIELRKRKELEISLLQQPIRNWSGDSIEKLGTMRLMTQTNIRAGNDQRQMSGFGLVFPSSIILITATERMSGFVLITNLPVNNASACRHNDKTVELTGHTGHFWLDFDKPDDAQEWWTAMQSLNIAKNRSSFIPYVATDNTEQKSKNYNRDTTHAASSTSSSTHASVHAYAKHAPVKQLVNSKLSSTAHHSSSPPPIKSSHSSSTLLSQGSSIFSLRPTPPCKPAVSPRTTSKDKKDSKGRRPRSRPRNTTPDPDQASNRYTRIQTKNTQEDEDVLHLFNCYDEKIRQRKTSEPATRSYTHLTRQSLGPASISHEHLEKIVTSLVDPLKNEVLDLRNQIKTLEDAMSTEQTKVRNIRAHLQSETTARKMLETNIVKWQQDHTENLQTRTDQ